MRKFLSLLIIMIVLGLVTGCTPHNTPNLRLDVSMDVTETTLIQFWQEVSEKASIQKETASINNFTLDTDKKGLIEQATYIVLALNSENQPMSYLINVNKSGEMQISFDNINPSDYDIYRNQYRSLSLLFSQMDKIGLSCLQAGSEGISIRLIYVSDLLYQSNPPQWLLFELKDGTLIPLESVKPEPGYRTALITINKKNSAQPRQEWFLSEDLERADIVKYLAN